MGKIDDEHLYDRQSEEPDGQVSHDGDESRETDDKKNDGQQAPEHGQGDVHRQLGICEAISKLFKSEGAHDLKGGEPENQQDDGNEHVQ